MHIFVADRMDRLERLIDASNGVLDAYRRLDLQLAPMLLDLLDAAAAEYGRSGRPDRRNEVLALTAQFVSAQHGTNPLTFERVTTRRREVERAIALHAVLECSERLRADLAGFRQVLDAARQEMQVLVLHALQQGILVIGPGAVFDQHAADALWRALLADAETQLAARQVAMRIGRPDVELLLCEIVSDCLDQEPDPVPAPT